MRAETVPDAILARLLKSNSGRCTKVACESRTEACKTLIFLLVSGGVSVDIGPAGNLVAKGFAGSSGIKQVARLEFTEGTQE